MAELLIGCGSSRAKRMHLVNQDSPDWTDLTTCDMNPAHEPDVVWDLRKTPWEPFTDNEFDQVHAYEVLEHLGAQGDYEAFFAQFYEIWRILVPDGRLYASVPAGTSPWLWADPSHTRAILPETLVFLNQNEYERQVGITSMSDFRSIWKGDFLPVQTWLVGDTFGFVLKAVKP